MKKMDKPVGETLEVFSKRQQNTVRYDIFTTVITSDVAPIGSVASDGRFGEIYCLRLLGKGEESVLKVEAFGRSEMLAVVTRIHSMTRLKTRCSSVYNICFWSSTPYVLTVIEQFSCHFFPSDKNPRTSV